MAPVIHIRPAEGWGYFTKNKERLSTELVEIASNEGTNTSVYMTEESGQPYLYVYRDDKKVFQSACSTIYETERNLRLVYEQYLSVGETKKTVDTPSTGGNTLPSGDDSSFHYSDIDSMTESEFQDCIDEREGVILTAVLALIETLTEDSVSDVEYDDTCDDCIDNIVDHIVEYLAIDCGLRVRRPMTVLDDDTKCHVRTEYPYEEYVFSEDELHK